MNARETFKKNYFKALVQLSKVKNEIENMKNEYEKTNGNNWGYAGSLGHINEELKDIMDFFHIK